MLVCISVWNRFTIEIYKFTPSLRTFLACAAQMYGFTPSLRTFLACAAQMYGFTHSLRTFRVYGLMPSLRTFRVCAAHGAIAIEDSEDRRQRQARKCIQRKRRWLATQQRYERRQDNSDRRRPAYRNLLTA